METACIKCGEFGYVKMDVDSATLYCTNCEKEYAVAEVREHVDAWLAVLPWMESHPKLKGGTDGK